MSSTSSTLSSSSGTSSSAPSMADVKAFHTAQSLNNIPPTILFGATGTTLYNVAEQHHQEKRSTVNSALSPAEQLNREEKMAEALASKQQAKWKQLAELLYECWELSIEKGVVDARVQRMKQGVASIDAAQKEARASKRKMLSFKEEEQVKRQMVSDVRRSFARITSGTEEKSDSDQGLLGDGVDDGVRRLNVRLTEGDTDSDESG